MHLFQILLPRTDNAGQPFARHDYDRLKKELAELYGGVTAYLQSPAEGLWQRDGGSGEDEIIILEVMTEEIDLPAWQRRRAELEQRFRQDEIVIRHSPITLI